MIVFILLIFASVVGFAQPYEPTFLFDEIGVPNEPFGLSVLAPLGDQDEDGYDDILMSVWEGEGWYYHLRIVYGGAEPPYRTLDFAHTNIDTSVNEYFWAQPERSNCADYNGDGYIDIMVDLIIRTGQNGRMYLFLGGPVFFDTLWDWNSGSFENLWSHGTVGDFDANGYADFIRDSRGLGPFKYYSGEWPNMSVDPAWSYGRGGGGYRNSQGDGDITGDGWPDFCYEETVDDTVWDDFWFGGPGADSIPDFSVSHYLESFFSGFWVIAGDLNGDGIDDLISNYGDTPDIRPIEVFFGGLPLDLEEPDVGIIRPFSVFYHAPFADLGDINDDGYDDVAFHDCGNGGDLPGGYIYIYLGGDPMDGINDFGIFPYFDDVFVPGCWPVDSAGDFNGDGIMDWMFASIDREGTGAQHRGRVTIVAGNERFGLSIPQGPPQLATDFTLGTPYPNPFNSGITIPLEIANGPRLVDIRIFDTLGRTVHAYGSLYYNRGKHLLTWDGAADSGVPSASGIYFVQALAGTQSATQKIQLIR